MNLVNRTRRMAALAAAAALLAAAQPATAQDITDSHQAAARTVISALGSTNEFDMVLPRAAHLLKAELIQRNPDLQADIIEVVDQVAISLAARRGDLEREAALAYARVFSEQELQDIAGFYTSASGKKLLESGPIVLREVYRAADIWQRGIARDLAQQVDQELRGRFADLTPVDGDAIQPEPLEGAAEEPAGQ